MSYSTYDVYPERYERDHSPSKFPDITVSELKEVLKFWDVESLDSLVAKVDSADDDWKVERLHKHLGVERVTLDFLIIHYKHHQWKIANPRKS